MRRSKFTILLIALLAWHSFAVFARPASDRITGTGKGEASDLSLIPGLAWSSAVWDATAKHLERRYRLHLVQVAGFAGSPPWANAHGLVIQPVVNAIEAYIKTNKLKSPKVIGHSLGGLMGLMLAAQHPEDVGKLMIVDALPFGGELAGANNVAEVKPFAAAMRDRILAQSQAAYAQNETNFIPSLVKSPSGQNVVIAWAVASDKSVVARAMYEDMTTDLRPELPKIKIPVTILYPWDAAMGISQTACDRLYQESYAALPDKKFVRIDGSFHFIMFDQPEKFAAQVDTFLK